MTGAEQFYNWHNRCNILKRLFEPHDLELRLGLKRFGYIQHFELIPLNYISPEFLCLRNLVVQNLITEGHDEHLAKYIIAQDLDKLYGVPECLTAQLTYRIIDDIIITRGGKHK